MKRSKRKESLRLKRKSRLRIRHARKPRSKRERIGRWASRRSLTNPSTRVKVMI